MTKKQPSPNASVERLLQVSAALFAEFGREGVTIREVSRRAELPVPTIYYHFASKEHLYQAAFARKIESTISTIDARVQGARDAGEKFNSLVEAFFELFTGDPVLYLLIQRDMIDAAGRRRPQLSMQQYAHFSALIETAISEWLGKTVESRLAQSVGALILGTCAMATISQDFYGDAAQSFLQDQKRHLVAVARDLLRSV